MKRLLVANRGEIAVRIIRAARDLGHRAPSPCTATRTADALHVRLADAAVGDRAAAGRQELSA